MVLAGAAVYVHARIGDFVASRSMALALRVALVALGLALGATMAALIPYESPALLALFGVGLVHAPAACVVLLKSRRGEGPS